MGTVHKPTCTKPLPSKGELFTPKGETFARVKPPKGRAIAYPMTTGEDGSQRIVVESGTYVAKYGDGSGLVHTVSTGCRDEGAARSMLNELERRSELAKAGVMTAGEDRIADHQNTKIESHFDDYATHLRAKGVSSRHLEYTQRISRRLFDERGLAVLRGCEEFVEQAARLFVFSEEKAGEPPAATKTSQPLRDIQQGTMEGWLSARLDEGMGARTRNIYLQTLRGFTRWAVESHRLAVDPLQNVHKADEKSDRRLTRRALTEAQLHRLLHVARWRPLAEFGRVSVQKNAEDVSSKRGTWKMKPLASRSATTEAGRSTFTLCGQPSGLI